MSFVPSLSYRSRSLAPAANATIAASPDTAVSSLPSSRNLCLAVPQPSVIPGPVRRETLGGHLVVLLPVRCRSSRGRHPRPCNQREYTRRTKMGCRFGRYLRELRVRSDSATGPASLYALLQLSLTWQIAEMRCFTRRSVSRFSFQIGSRTATEVEDRPRHAQCRAGRRHSDLHRKRLGHHQE